MFAASVTKQERIAAVLGSKEENELSTLAVD